MVKGMKIEFDDTPTQHYLSNCKISSLDNNAISSEIQKLLSKQVIEPTGHTEFEIISDFVIISDLYMGLSFIDI